MKTDAGDESSTRERAWRHVRPPLLFDRLGFERHMGQFRSAQMRCGPLQGFDTSAEHGWEDEGGASARNERTSYVRQRTDIRRECPDDPMGARETATRATNEE